MGKVKEQKRIFSGISDVLFLRLGGEFMCLHAYYISLLIYMSNIVFCYQILYICKDYVHFSQKMLWIKV